MLGMKNSIYLTGFMGSGKSTCGKILSQNLNLRHFDTDQMIENDFEMSTFDIIEKFGIEYFRKIENQKLAYVTKLNGVVVSLGGGTLIAQKNQKQVLKKGILVYLRWTPEALIKNLQKIKKRPLLKNIQKDAFERLFLERAEGYAQAQIVIDCDSKSPQSVVKDIQNELQNFL
jgi:shikimate kinase